MNNIDLSNRLTLILTKAELKRVRLRGQNITIDLHGLNRRSGERLARNITALCGIYPSMNIMFIHGFRHGEILKKMILDQAGTFSRKIIDRRTPSSNPGITCIKTAA